MYSVPWNESCDLQIIIAYRAVSIKTFAFLSLFRKDGSNLKEEAGRVGSPSPSLLAEGSLKALGKIAMIADTQVLCTMEGATLMQASLGIMAVYYVFMYAYPVEARALFIYLQKCILQIQDGKKLPISVLNFLSDIERQRKTS